MPTGRYIVVTGLPASGKTTVARTVARALALPMFDKDDFLEALFEGVSVGSALQRRELSHRADREFRRPAEQAKGRVLASWWKHPKSPVDSGTSTGWLASLPGPNLELQCACSAATADERFMARKRHPGHLDDRWTHADLLASFEQQQALGPLRVGHLTEVNTEAELELGVLLRDIACVFDSAAVGQQALILANAAVS